MNLSDKVVVVTGGAHGIGRALCERFAQEQTRGIVVADIDHKEARKVATSIGGFAVDCDVSREDDIVRLVNQSVEKYGQIDLFCANAGIAMPGGLEVPDEDWRTIMDVNFMSHVYAVRAVLPGMLQRGRGYLLHTASAAGLLTEIASAPYSVTKHAVVSFAEWIAITYGDRGIKVSCLCPQGVKTRMLAGDHPGLRMLNQTALAPEQVADKVVTGLHEEGFLILPHPEVAEYFQRKAADYDRWLRGMRRLRDTWEVV